MYIFFPAILVPPQIFKFQKHPNSTQFYLIIVDNSDIEKSSIDLLLKNAKWAISR